MASNSNLTWNTINVDTLGKSEKAAYDSYRAAYRAASELRESFEAAMRKSVKLAAGQDLVFSYNFGRLSIAVGDARSKNTASSGGKSFADFAKSVS